MTLGRTILLVEDEALVAMMEKSVLQRAGYSVCHVSSGEKAIEAVSGEESPDIILMDIDLGEGMDGTEAAEKILSIRELPLVFLSSHTEPEIVEKTEGITSYGYIVKHSGNTVLLASIRMAFRLFEEKQAVRRHEQLLNGVFNSIQDGISVLDRDLRICHVNHAMERWYPEPEGILGRRCHEVYHHTEQICHFCPSVKALQSGKVERGVVPGRKDSTAEWLELYAYPMVDATNGETTGVVEFVRDISLLRRQQSELEKKTAALELLLQVGESLSNVMEIEHILQTLSDSVVQLVEMDTAAIYTLNNNTLYLGATTPPLPSTFPETLRHAPLDEHPHLRKCIEERKPSFILDFQKADLTQAEKQASDMRRLRSVITVPLIGREGVLGVMIVATSEDVREPSEEQLAHCRTITTQAALAIENARLHNSLQTSQRKLSDAAMMAGIGHWEYNVESELFTFSDSFYRMFRTTAEEQGGYQMALAEYARRFVHPDDVHMVAEAAQEAIASTDPEFSRSIEHRVIFGDKAPGYIEVKFSLQKDATGRTVATYGVNQDISDRKAAEEETRRRLQEQEILLKEVHHRIKNSFSTVGSILKLQAQETSNPEARDAIGEALHRVDSMQQLYDTLLFAGNYREASMKEYLERLLSSLRGTLNPVIAQAIHTEIEDYVVQIRTLVPLGMIVNELITNAAKHAFVHSQPGTIHLSAHRYSEGTRLVVQDNGDGLPDGFQPESSGGFGMMLVRLLAEQLNGTVWIGAAESGSGTVAILEFPSD